MDVQPSDERLKGLANFYSKYTQEKIEELKPFFNNFVEKSDFASLTALSMSFEDVKRALYVRDTLKVHTQPVVLPVDDE
jgi:hypothetical protein